MFGTNQQFVVVVYIIRHCVLCCAVLLAVLHVGLLLSKEDPFIFLWTSNSKEKQGNKNKTPTQAVLPKQHVHAFFFCFNLYFFVFFLALHMLQKYWEILFTANLARKLKARITNPSILCQVQELAFIKIHDNTEKNAERASTDN
jgi:hypothetical protein